MFMQEWLDNNDVLIYLTHNKSKSVIAVKIIKTLKAKNCKNITDNYGKSYFAYLRILVDQYINSYHYSINTY